jgi:hypothetical protein
MSDERDKKRCAQRKRERQRKKKNERAYPLACADLHLDGVEFCSLSGQHLGEQDVVSVTIPHLSLPSLHLFCPITSRRTACTGCAALSARHPSTASGARPAGFQSLPPRCSPRASSAPAPLAPVLDPSMTEGEGTGATPRFNGK